jgi:hypothetical protein
MAQLVEQHISGNGEANFSGSSVAFILVHLTVLGPDVFVRDLGNPDQLIKAGWLSLGSTTDLVESTSHTYWNKPIWLDFVDFIWHPYPTNQHGNPPDFGVWADTIRWALSPDTEADIIVWGAP